MSKTSILVIIFCTAIVSAVVFFALQEDPSPSMEDVYLFSSENIEKASPEDLRAKNFYNLNSQIYLVIPLKDVDSGDLLKVSWVFMGEDSYRIIQEDNIEIDESGSGEITVYLVRKDNAYNPGEYKVRVEYNNIQEKEASFTITAESGS